jgi:hypothetical protein
VRPTLEINERNSHSFVEKPSRMGIGAVGSFSGRRALKNRIAGVFQRNRTGSSLPRNSQADTYTTH